MFWCCKHRTWYIAFNEFIDINFLILLRTTDHFICFFWLHVTVICLHPILLSRDWCSTLAFCHLRIWSLDRVMMKIINLSRLFIWQTYSWRPLNFLIQSVLNVGRLEWILLIFTFLLNLYGWTSSVRNYCCLWFRFLFFYPELISALKNWVVVFLFRSQWIWRPFFVSAVFHCPTNVKLKHLINKYISTIFIRWLIMKWA